MNSKEIIIVASGDLRLSANQICWPAQQQMEEQLINVFKSHGYSTKRAHEYDSVKQHGLIDSQRMGIEVFKNIDPNAKLVVAESMWQYSHHVLAGLMTHKGPILTVANWSGQWPGLVGLLNLNGSLTKAGVNYSSIWSEDFKDSYFTNGLTQWLNEGTITHDSNHVKSYSNISINTEEAQIGINFAQTLRKNKSIMGVFDEGCMGMYNAIIPDDVLMNLGVYKERLSQSALYCAMREVTNNEAQAALDWLLAKGMKFNWGQDGATQLTKEQTLEQCKMYIAAMRMADDFGCDTIGIQYQQGMKDLTPTSDLAEGLLNNTERPPVFSKAGKELYAGAALPHFNEVDECAGLDSLITYHLWRKLGMSGENTLHDLRWGQHYTGQGIDDFVWVFLISGAAPAAHFANGYADASSERQPAIYFPMGGGSLKGNSKPGHIVWSRIYLIGNILHADLGVGEVVNLPQEETNRRWAETTSEWPLMSAVIKGVSRDQMMARHKANHIQVVYANDVPTAHKSCRIKAAALAELGIIVHFCGDVQLA